MVAAASKTSSRILVVEDNPNVTRALSALLREQGYQPVVFNAAQPAVEFMRDNRPDMALIDIHLPDVSGLDLSQQIRQRHGDDLPIIILSADTSIDTLRQLPEAGATFFLSKPVNASHLLDCVRDRLAGATSA